MQLELRWYQPGSVRAVLTDYLAMRSEGITAETRDNDYRWRVEWLIDVLGESTMADAIDYNRLEWAARRDREVLRDVTIKKRLAFWRAAVQYAALRGTVPRAAVPELPPWLRDDGRQMTDFYSLAQFQEFRMALAPGRFRRFAELGYWSAMHSLDLFGTSRAHLEPDFRWEGSDRRGRWWRRNNKNVRGRKGKPSKVLPCWIPMEPELRELSLEWLSERGEPGALIVGELNNVNKTFEAASARAGLPRIRPNLGMRASHSSMLLSRGYNYEYVRIVLGHVSEVRVREVDVAPAGPRDPQSHMRVSAVRHSTTLASYLRPSPDTMKPRG